MLSAAFDKKKCKSSWKIHRQLRLENKKNRPVHEKSVEHYVVDDHASVITLSYRAGNKQGIYHL